MPRNPQNFWEVLGQAGQAGLGQVGATYAAGKQQERDNALTSFMSVLRQQDADRQTAESMSRMSLLRSKMMESSERLKQLQKSPSEVGAAQGEQQLGQLQTMLSGLTESGNISDIPFTNDIAGGLESVYQGLPPGTDLNLGPLQMSAPDQLSPLDAANTQSLIDYRAAMAGRAGQESTTGQITDASLLTKSSQLRMGQLNELRKRKRALEGELTELEGDKTYPPSAEAIPGKQAELNAVSQQIMEFEGGFGDSLNVTVQDFRQAMGGGSQAGPTLDAIILQLEQELNQ